MQQGWIGVNGGYGAHAFVDDSIADGVPSIGTPQCLCDDGIHVIAGCLVASP